MNKTIRRNKVLVIAFLIVVTTISSTIFATKKNETLVISNYQKEELDVFEAIEKVMQSDLEIKDSNSLIKNNNESELLIEYLNIDLSNNENFERIYDSKLDREVTRITTSKYEMDFTDDGEIVGYKNYLDYSTENKDKKDYSAKQILQQVEVYNIDTQKEIMDIVEDLSSKVDFSDYKLVDCNNSLKKSWVLTWCKEYENGLTNPYDCINIVVDAEDGSIMLYGKNTEIPNTLIPTITKDRAIEIAEKIINENCSLLDENIKVELNIFKPNFFWNDNKLYEEADFVRLAWKVSANDSLNVQVDAVTGEILGGDINKSICARSMAVVPFVGYEECAQLAYDAFNRLGYNQSWYEPVTWEITQADINWVLSRTDLYALYLTCHGNISEDGTYSILSDGESWEVDSRSNFGVWRFVYLDACKTSSTNHFANAFQATYAGECFVGWNVYVNVYTALDFNRRFFPRLGYMTVYDAVVTSLWESRNAGYNQINGNICDPGFLGDMSYYGWAW